MRRLLACILLALLPFVLAACSGQEESGEVENLATADAADRAELDRGSGEIAWLGYAEGMDLARSEGKFVLVDFWTSWCHWCKVMDKDTYSQESVQRRLAASFVAIKVNAESGEAQGPEGSPSGKDLAREYQVSTYPMIWFVEAKGQRIAPLPGFVPPEHFVMILDYISTGAYKTQDFETFLASEDQPQG